MQVLKYELGKHPEFVFTYFGKSLNSANTKYGRPLWREQKVMIYAVTCDTTRLTGIGRARTSTDELKTLGGWKTRSMVDRYAKFGTEHLMVAAERIERVSVEGGVAEDVTNSPRHQKKKA
jgi:hypothetical protein